jgi:phage recombination protein Bet
MTTTAGQTAPTKNEKYLEYIPFGAADKIKLSVALVISTICIPTKLGKLCTERDALRFLMLCQAQRLNPYAGDCTLCGYDSRDKGPQFSMITNHQTFLKRAETCSDYEGMESGIILLDEQGKITEREGDFCLPSENVVGGWARVFRKNRKPLYKRLSIEQRRPNYETPFWNVVKAPEQICKCAEADALRATFPTLLGGLYSGQELDMSATVSSTGVADALVNKPLFQAPAEPAQQLQAAAEQPERPLEPSPESVKENGDKMREAMATAKQSSNPTPQQDLQKLMEVSGVTFQAFTDFIAAKNIAADADSWPSWDDVPTAVCETFAALPKTVLELIRTAKAKKGAK